MLMLTIQTFLLMLLAGLLGLVVGSLLACRGPGDVAWSDDRPWLRDAPVPLPAPVLPAAPTLLSAEERASLVAARGVIAETSGIAPAPAALGTALPEDAVRMADPTPSTAAAIAAVERRDDRPWLRDPPVAPPPPVLPSPPTLLTAEERSRLAAALAETHTAAMVASPPSDLDADTGSAPGEAAAVPVDAAPAVPPPAVAEPAAPPAPPSTTEAVPVAAPAADVAFALPPEIAAAAVAPTVAAEDVARAEAADAVGTRPMALANPLGGKADDLKRIRGIGPQNERKLHGLGVYHFSQIAAWTAENAKWAGSFMAFPGRIEREDWIAQAEVLATGAETEFSKRVDAGEVPTSQSDVKG